MPRARDGGLAAGLLGAVALLAIVVDASIAVPWLLGGVATTMVLEILAHRRPAYVQEQFDRRPVLLGALLLVAVGIGAGVFLAPDRALSVAIGALVTYLCLLVAVAATGWSPRDPT